MRHVLINDYINKNSFYLLIILIFVYAFYIQLYGEVGPGGGFQGGILLASGFILHAFLFDCSETLKIIKLSVLRILAAVGVLIYFTTGLISLFFNRNFLNYDVIFPNNRHLAQAIGVFCVEIGVGITVFSTMLIIFFSFLIFNKNIDHNDKKIIE